MSETNGGTGGMGAEDYRPRHAVPEIYQEMLDTFGDPNRTDDKLYIPKHYVPEDDPYSTAYYIPITDLSDPDIDAGPVPPWSPPEEPEEPVEPEEREEPEEPVKPEVKAEEEEIVPPEPPITPLPQRLLLPEPEPPPVVPSLPPLVFRSRTASVRRLRHVTEPDNREWDAIIGPPPGKPPPGEPPGAPPPQRERWKTLKKLQNAYYAGVAAVTAFLTDPEKERRRRIIARTAVVAAGAIAVGLAVWLGPDLHNHHHNQPPYVPQPTGPPPNTEQFFDTIKPGNNYHGEMYEWSTAANNVGPAEATPKLLRLISHARDNGLSVDTWGNPGHGHWGINSVTVELPDGTYKSYYDTPRKLAILQWYAGGMGPHHG